MRISDAWARGQSNQNVVVKVANLQVMARFGTAAPPAEKARQKPKKDTKFVVGQTSIGGEETV